MLFTLIVVFLLAAGIGGYYGWCLHVQRDQPAGRHRPSTPETSSRV